MISAPILVISSPQNCYYSLSPSNVHRVALLSHPSVHPQRHSRRPWMFGGGDQKLETKDFEKSPQLPINPRAMVISNPSAALNLADQNSAHVFAGEDMQTGMVIQQAGSIIIHSKDDLQELGHKIMHHEDHVKYLKTRKTKLEESIIDMTATLENQIKETKWKKDRMAEDLLREQSYLDHAKVNYEMKKQ